MMRIDIVVTVVDVQIRTSLPRVKLERLGQRDCRKVLIQSDDR